jgi:hypothetical protein
MGQTLPEGSRSPKRIVEDSALQTEGGPAFYEVACEMEDSNGADKNLVTLPIAW